ncbi:MAG: SRPBCC domain-containing protein [Chloroflexota bacterium]|nr:SRPBCC domain-containing protein [Chloroflexota bacterium]
MARGLVSTASTTIDAPIAKVWDALVNPAMIKQYMFGTEVVSDWREGSPIVWRGDYQGKPYADKGVILRLQPQRELQYTHFSPLSGKPDQPENYHTVTLALSRQGAATTVSLAQDNNPDEEAREETTKVWRGMLDALKGLLQQ